MKQRDRYRHLHWGDLANSTHRRGAGTYDEVAGERFRIEVTLATDIPEEQVRMGNLDHLDPAREVDIAAWAADPDTGVPNAGEELDRLSCASRLQRI